MVIGVYLFLMYTRGNPMVHKKWDHAALTSICIDIMQPARKLITDPIMKLEDSFSTPSFFSSLRMSPSRISGVMSSYSPLSTPNGSISVMRPGCAKIRMHMIQIAAVAVHKETSNAPGTYHARFIFMGHTHPSISARH
eukprot:1142016-Pelagomonas_calceolata.AAC.4